MVTGLSLLRSDPTMRRAVILFLAVGFVLRLAAPAVAFHGITPPLLQIPPEGRIPVRSRHPHWGGLRYVLFDSDADLTEQPAAPGGSSSSSTFASATPRRSRASPSSPAAPATISGHALDAAPSKSRSKRSRAASGPRQIMLVDRRTGVEITAHRRCQQQPQPGGRRRRAHHRLRVVGGFLRHRRRRHADLQDRSSPSEPELPVSLPSERQWRPHPDHQQDRQQSQREHQQQRQSHRLRVRRRPPEPGSDREPDLSL